MNDEQWDTFALLLDKGFKWREPFGSAHEFTYRTLLDGCDPEEVATALRALIARGQVFGPTPGEIVEQIRKDPSRPSFDEAWQLIRVCLKARTQIRKAFWEPGERDKLNEEAANERACQPDIHPLVAPFMARQGGPTRLRALGLEDPENEYREARRHELQAAWERFVEDSEGREVAALASGRKGAIGRFDPLAALGVDRREIPEEASA